VSLEYTSIIYIGVGIAGFLLLLLITMICLYKKHKKLYSLAADKRMKRGLNEGAITHNFEGKSQINEEQLLDTEGDHY
jgi:hypothetical protein